MEDREGKSVYVRKYDVLPESIISYFKTIARGLIQNLELRVKK